MDEIERWYVKLSGKEWADLAADGQVDPLTAEGDHTVLSRWLRTPDFNRIAGETRTQNPER